MPLWGVAYTFDVALVDSGTKQLRANPTLATGDVKVVKDGGALTDITTLPDPEPNSSRVVRVQLSATEMEADRVAVQFVDAAGSEWDEVVYTLDNTEASNPGAVRNRKAQGGANGSITLDASASAVDDYYKTAHVEIVGGTGAGQTRQITGYTGFTKVATVAPNWATNPDNTSIFVVWARGRSDVGLWNGTAPNNLQSGRMDSYLGAGATDVIDSTLLAASAAQEIRNAITGYAGALDTDANGRVRIVDGTGAGELDTSSGTVTVGTNNDKTGYRLSATGVDDIWDEAAGTHTASGSFGEYLGKGIIAAAGSVVDVTPGAGDFTTGLSGANDFWNDSVLIFTSGALAGQARAIDDFVSAGGQCIFLEPFTAAPANGDTFLVLAGHVHPGTQLASDVWTHATRTLTAATNITSTGGTTVPQTGDSYARLGAPVGASVSADVLSVYNRLGAPVGVSMSADIAAVQADTDDIQTRLPAALVSGRMDASVGAMAANVLTASAAATDFGGEIQALITGGAYPIDTDANGRIRIVDGTGIGEIDTSSGRVQITEAQIDQIVDEVWDELAADHVGAGSLGERVERLDLLASGGAGGLTNARAVLLDNLDAAVSTRATPAQVNAEVVDCLATDTYAEPGQGAPAATTTLAAKINYLYKAWRNKKTQTSSQFSLYADDGSTVDQKSSVSDDGTTTTFGELATGP